MPILPSRFLVRLAYRCRYVKGMPRERDDLLDLPDHCRIDNLAAMDGIKSFADLRLAWNDLGLGAQIEVRGKNQAIACDQAKPRASDGLTLWLDTRDARTSHRASRHCHQFTFLPAGGGSDREDPTIAQAKIHRALQDAPMASSQAIPFRARAIKGGYRLEAFLPAGVLHGFDPDQNRRLGFYYVVRDNELGEQTLSVSADFPYWEDPSLWSTLELVR